MITLDETGHGVHMEYGSQYLYKEKLLQRESQYLYKEKLLQFKREREGGGGGGGGGLTDKPWVM